MSRHPFLVGVEQQRRAFEMSEERPLLAVDNGLDKFDLSTLALDLQYRF